MLGLTGLFLYLRFRADLNDTIAGSLSSRSDEHAVVRADRVRLEQALGNLVDNALRHGAGDAGGAQSSDVAAHLSCSA